MGLKKLFLRKKKSNKDRKDDNDNVVSSTSHVSVEEQLKHVFKKFDVNHDGKISSTELGLIMGSLGHRPKDEELEWMIKEVDADGDGFIDLDEFIALNTKDVDSSEMLENMKEVFSIFDIDKNGLISADELHKVLGQLEWRFTIEECRKMIAGVDVNGDGMISFDEFKVMMMNGMFDGIGSK